MGCFNYSINGVFSDVVSKDGNLLFPLTRKLQMNSGGDPWNSLISFSSVISKDSFSFLSLGMMIQQFTSSIDSSNLGPLPCEKNFFIPGLSIGMEAFEIVLISSRILGTHLKSRTSVVLLQYQIPLYIYSLQLFACLRIKWLSSLISSSLELNLSKR